MKNFWYRIFPSICFECKKAILIQKDRVVHHYKTDQFGFDREPLSFMHRACYMKTRGLTDADDWTDEYTQFKKLKANVDRLVGISTGEMT